MSRVPDDKSLVFLPAEPALLLDESGRPRPRLREFIATRGNKFALFDTRRIHADEARRDMRELAPALCAAYGWHAPHWPAYSWDALRHAAPHAPAPPAAALATLSESLLLRWLEAAGVPAPLVFVVSAHGAEGVFTRGSRRITFVPAERFLG